MTIYQNLRELRRISGLTQEEVANRIGLTRQAISSYESGRTQPDLSMLIKLAEIYQTDISDILYGSNQTQRKLHTLKTTAKILFAAILFFVFASAGLLLITNLCFALPDGLEITEATRPLVDFRFTLLKVTSLLGGVAQLIAWAGSIIIAVLLTGFRRLPSLKYGLIPALALMAAASGLSLFLSAFDPIYTRADYLLNLLNIFPPIILLVVYWAVLKVIRTARAKNPRG